MAENINLLVLSDLHIDNTKLVDQKIVLSALYNDLRIINDTELKPQYVVFNGDLVQDPDDPDAYMIFLEQFFLPVMETLAIPESNILFVPGNHDVSRSAIAQFGTENAGIISSIDDQAAINRIYQSQRSSAFLVERQNAFFQALGAFQGGRNFEQDPFIISSTYPGDRLTLIGINTAIFSMGGTRGPERQKLAFPDVALNGALASIPQDYTIVTALHHPLDWLTENTRRELRSSLLQRSHVSIFGHLHDPEPRLEVAPSGSFVGVQLSSLFSTRNYANGYSILSISRTDQHVRATYRTYFDGRRKFDKGLNVAAEGVFYPTIEAERYFLQNEETLGHRKLRQWISTYVSPHLGPVLDECTSDKPLSSIFVEPPLLQTLSSEQVTRDADPSDLETKVTLAQIADSSGHYFFLVPSEYGQTSLARRLAAIILESSTDVSRATTAKPNVPVILDVAETSIYESNILRRIKAWLPDTASLGHTSQSLVDGGFVTLIFENIEITSKDTLERLQKLRERYPQCRFIYFVRSPLSFGAERIVKIPFDGAYPHIQVRTFNRTLVRKLVERWRLDNTFKTDVIVEQIISRFHLLSIPITPVNVTIFLTVVETVRGFTPINTASLIENYIDITLEKYDLKAAFRATFDYKNKVDYLAHVARNMVERNEFRLDYGDLYHLSENYFKSKMLDQRPQEVIEYFIGAKIFEALGNAIQFRLNAFESYFIAQAMIVSPEFKERIVGEFTKFATEIDIYCGSQRGDASVINHVAREYQKLYDEVMSGLSEIPKYTDLDNFALPGDTTAVGVLKRITQYAFNPRVSPEKKDTIVERTDSELKYNAVQEKIRRQEVRSSLVRWALALRTYSFCLKNLELLEGREKEEHLNVILQGWAQGLSISVFALRVLLETGEMDFEGVTLKSEVPTENLAKISGHAARFLFLFLPVIISYYLRNDLGSDKLDMVLRREASPVRSGPVEFMRACLFLDLRLREYPTIIGRIIKKLGKNKYLVEAMVMKLRDFYLRTTLEPTDDAAIRNLVMDLFQLLPSETAQGKKAAGARDIQSMRRKKVVKTIKDKLLDHIS